MDCHTRHTIKDPQGSRANFTINLLLSDWTCTVYTADVCLFARLHTVSYKIVAAAVLHAINLS